MAGYRETANAWEVRKYRLKSVLRRFYFCVFPAIEFFNSHFAYHQPNARLGKYAATKWCSRSDLPERRNQAVDAISAHGNLCLSQGAAIHRVQGAW